ncbi:hypothetical protein F2Q70_00008487, partial [Brassica cretica]
MTVTITHQSTYIIVGAHSVGRVHCVNLVHRLYPTIDPTLDPDYALYLKNRCPSPNPDPNAVLYSRNDRETPMVVDNMYYKNIMAHKGLLVIDDELASDPRTAPFVAKMAADNGYFHEQFSRGVRLLSETNPLTDPDYALYLKNRCPSPNPDPNAVLYSRNDRETPMVVDNMYYKNIMAHKGLLVIDDELASDPRTAPFVAKMAADNGYFHEQFSRGVRLLSETNPLTGAHSVGRVHCVNLVHRLYPTIDPTLDPDYALYLKNRCPSPNPDPNAVLYSRNDRETPMVVDNMYYKNIMAHKGLLVIDDELASDPRTAPFVAKMAADNGYFHEQFSRGVRLLSETNPLT